MNHCSYALLNFYLEKQASDLHIIADQPFICTVHLISCFIITWISPHNSAFKLHFVHIWLWSHPPDFYMCLAWHCPFLSQFLFPASLMLAPILPLIRFLRILQSIDHLVFSMCPRAFRHHPFPNRHVITIASYIVLVTIQHSVLKWADGNCPNLLDFSPRSRTNPKLCI